MSEPLPAFQTRQVDLAGVAAFARGLVAALREQPGVDVLAALRSGVHAHCPQCQFRLFGEDVLALAASEAPAAETSPKLHRLAGGYCARQGCDGRFYEFAFDPVPGVDWSSLLARLEAGAGAEATGAAAAVPGAAVAAGAARRRTRRRVVLGLAVVVVLLLVRHILTGGAIPWIREPRRFTADPATMPRLGQTNTEAPPALPDTNRPRTFRAAPPNPVR
jgi:hypothetical protein